MKYLSIHADIGAVVFSSGMSIGGDGE